MMIAPDRVNELKSTEKPIVRATVIAKAPRAQGSPGGSLPVEVEFILSALEAGASTSAGPADRRRGERMKYHVCASLKLYSEPEAGLPWQIFVRDVNPKGLGFLTRHRLPLGYGGILTVVSPQGGVAKIDCTLVRCREAVPGWFEGSMYFNREQGAFAVTSDTNA
ncbi:MAG TPA: hypothetical protein VK986_21035 [Tepidisphaeraceae bacterium]|nr:hypothetical protein [Tepidisphaeraceae bacterium]